MLKRKQSTRIRTRTRTHTHTHTHTHTQWKSLYIYIGLMLLVAITKAHSKQTSLDHVWFSVKSVWYSWNYMAGNYDINNAISVVVILNVISFNNMFYLKYIFIIFSWLLLLLLLLLSSWYYNSRVFLVSYVYTDILNFQPYICVQKRIYWRVGITHYAWCRAMR
jgi:hypothetical protein